MGFLHFYFLVFDPPRGRPVGGGGVHHNLMMGKNPLIDLFAPLIFMGNPVFLWFGFSYHPFGG
jgi:hypothetical protein